MKNKKIIMIIGAAVLAILLGFGITYAYFTAKITGNESASTLSLEAGELTITMDGTNMMTTPNRILPSDEPFAVRRITLTGKNTTLDLSMPYTLTLVVDNNTFSPGAIKYSLTGVNNSNSGQLIPEKTLEIVDDTVTLGSGFFERGSQLTHTYTLSVYFPETNEDQSTDMGATFAAHIEIVGEKAEEPPFDFGSLIGTSGDGSLYEDDYGNLRYDGANPNNYATFNGDVAGWRIIGIFDVKTSESGTTEKRIKLIKNDSIGISYFGSNNTWSSSYIRDGFSRAETGTAYGTVSGADQSPSSFTFALNNVAQSQIDNAVWYIGASDYDITASQAYNAEHDSSTNPWTGKMGLMSASDYGFASSSCKDGSQTLFNYHNSSCTGSNWLFKGIGEWTIIPYSGHSHREFNVRSTGFVGSDGSTDSREVRPVVYLKSNIKVTGSGTSGSPYTFS